VNSSIVARDVVIRSDRVSLGGRIAVPRDAAGVVVFAHGSGSSRFSPRNGMVAATLQEHGLGTLLFDLLTTAESQDRTNVFDIGLLARRLEAAIDWCRADPALAGLDVGLFGASTGAAAALSAAASRPGVKAVVSRGGRPDLAGGALPGVSAATLLIVGGRDQAVLDLNRAAFEQLRCPKRLEVVPGAGHLFEEPGALEAVAGLAANWFVAHLGVGSTSTA
jgi:putative phosphoribosyl transferase